MNPDIVVAFVRQYQCELWNEADIRQLARMARADKPRLKERFLLAMGDAFRACGLRTRGLEKPMAPSPGTRASLHGTKG